MTTGTPPDSAAATAPRTLAIMPPVTVPSAMSRSAASASSSATTFPSAPRTPGTSVRSSRPLAPTMPAICAAASSALTLRIPPASHVAIDERTGR
jgi:hypothetical protein